MTRHLNPYQQKHYGDFTDLDLARRLLEIVNTNPYRMLARTLIIDGWTEDQLAACLAEHPLFFNLPDPEKVKIQNAFRDEQRGLPDEATGR